MSPASRANLFRALELEVRVKRDQALAAIEQAQRAEELVARAYEQQNEALRALQEAQEALDAVRAWQRPETPVDEPQERLDGPALPAPIGAALGDEL